MSTEIVLAPKAAAAPEKIGAIFQTVPPRVRAAWEVFQYVRARSKQQDTQLSQYEALAKVCWEDGLRTGYFLLDGFLVGWAGYPRERRFAISPASRPLKPQTHVELAYFFHIYGRNPSR